MTERESLKRSIALVIREPEGETRWLLVQRPADDEELPDVWGLPAGTHRPGESVEALVRRIGRDKLGVELEAGDRLAGGSADRPGYRLEMELIEARVVSGEITVGRGPDTVTQYADGGWKPPSCLAEGAGRGSLCCALGGEWAGISGTE